MQNIDVLWKECLHSDGEQCHQYQQNETHLSLQLIEHKQRRRHMTLKI
jgi:hypothetical protein